MSKTDAKNYWVDGEKQAPATRALLKEPDRAIRVTRKELLKIMLVADKALDGDSNDDEHDALFEMREALSELLEDDERTLP